MQPMEKTTEWTRGFLAVVLVVIFLANFFNYVDRMVLSGLEDAVKERFGIGKTAFGFLWAAFTIGYLVTSPFIGYLADHVRRTRLFALCVVVWSAATVGCALVEVFWQLVVMRVLIGIGEAGCLVVGPSLLADFFSRQKRGKALSVFFLGVPVGGAAGYILAGSVGFPNAFYIAGIPGFVVGALLYFMAEPERGGSEEGEAHGHGSVPAAGLKPYLDLLKTRSLLFIILAQTFAVITLMPLLHFGVEYFKESKVRQIVSRLPEGEREEMREWARLLGDFPPPDWGAHRLDEIRKKEQGGLSLSGKEMDFRKEYASWKAAREHRDEVEKIRKKAALFVTSLLGIFVLIGGPAGNFLGGLLGDKLRRRDPGAYAFLAGIGYLIGFPCTLFGMMFFPHPFSWVMLFLAFTALFACMPLVNTQIANVVSSTQRAMAFAAAVFILHILGDTVAVPLFGAIAEAGKDGGVLGFRLFPVSLVLAAVCSFVAWRAARGDVAALGLGGDESEKPDSGSLSGEGETGA